MCRKGASEEINRAAFCVLSVVAVVVFDVNVAVDVFVGVVFGIICVVLMFL